jgi:hypothetical protein
MTTELAERRKSGVSSSVPEQKVSKVPFSIVEFFCVSSIPELHWFITTTVIHFTNQVDLCSSKAPTSRRLSNKASNAYLSEYAAHRIAVDRDERTIAFPLSSRSSNDLELASALASIASFLAGLSALALWADVSNVPKPSIVRSRNTTLIVLDGLEKKLAESFSSHGEKGHGWTKEVAIIKAGMSEAALHDLQHGSSTSVLKAPPRKESNAASKRHSTKQSTSTHIAAFPASDVYTRPPITSTNVAAPIEDSQVTLVIPSAGRSSRFPGHKPKWLLTQPNGSLMLIDALAKLDLRHVHRVVVGVLKEHVDKYCVGDVQTLLLAFKDGHPRLGEIEISIVVISSETVDQVQTIECILDAAKVRGPIFLKDCDNQFACPVTATNGVAVLEITKEMQSISIPAHKSYANITGSGRIINIVEKVVLGNTFCIGGYSFVSAESMLAGVKTAREYQAKTGVKGVELAVSDVIWIKMLSSSGDSQPSPFVAISSSDYEDWGTLGAWTAYTATFKTLFLDIDGTIIRNSGQYFPPIWGAREPLHKNVAYLQSLRKRGRVQMILTTSRPESFREITERQLADAGVPYDKIVFGMFHAQRILVNDFAKTNPFPSALAVNLRRDADDLQEMMDLQI